jgi:tyrosyl-tRNA synthetase
METSTISKIPLLEELLWRGKIQDVSHLKVLSKILDEESITFYCGFDPTAESLHVGSLLPLTTIKRFIARGHKAIILIGSATGMIGDPSGKNSERTFLSEGELKKNVAGLEQQIKSFLASENPEQVEFVSNDSWLSSLSYIEILRDIGKDFSVNYMMNKDSVKSRLTEREQGISYTEFSYMLLQAYDFYYLYKHHNCRLQIGGSDQWGNITAGLDYIRKKNVDNNEQAFALTFPLVTNSDGKKFGKSEAGNIWLSSSLTSPYAFYQFWLNTSDSDITRFLPLFSFLTKEEISALISRHNEAPEKRFAQIALAEELTILLHGQEEFGKVKKASAALFSGSPHLLDGDSLLALSGEIPTLDLKVLLPELPKEGLLIQDIITQSGAAQSKSAARKLIQNGGVYLNHIKVEDIQKKVTLGDFLDDKALLLRTGKKNYYLITI